MSITKVLHILIPKQLQRGALSLAALGAGAVAFEDDDAVGGGGGDEGGAVAVAGPGAVRVEGDVAQAVAEGAQQERDVADEPGEPAYDSESVSWGWLVGGRERDGRGWGGGTHCKVWTMRSMRAWSGSLGEGGGGAIAVRVVCCVLVRCVAQ